MLTLITSAKLITLLTTISTLLNSTKIRELITLIYRRIDDWQKNKRAASVDPDKP
jgi:uncharacterized membrane-anchored protein YjiN (DUF445 family)